MMAVETGTIEGTTIGDEEVAEQVRQMTKYSMDLAVRHKQETAAS
jgi:hypothetical protein